MQGTHRCRRSRIIDPALAHEPRFIEAWRRYRQRPLAVVGLVNHPRRRLRRHLRPLGSAV